ncbi:MAG: hypothetical protein B6U85_02060 [Desulfurococcales archaeon ex4484_42]|nr:MAG: hypothetical protein B6U85_02060 [Desulfurococcales archaeon ex4484_42]
MKTWSIDDFGELSIGNALIKRDGNELYVKDLYGERTFMIDPDSHVEVLPIHPIFRLGNLTSTMYIKITTPMVGIGGKSYWLSIPYDLLIMVDGKPVFILSPFRIKYTLFGSITEGFICRYHESRVFRESKEVGDEYGRLLVSMPLNSKIGMYEFVLINMNSIKIFRSKEGLKVFYEVVRLPIDPLKPFAEPLGRPPKKDLEVISIPKDISTLTTGCFRHEYYGPD